MQAPPAMTRLLAPLAFLAVSCVDPAKPDTGDGRPDTGDGQPDTGGDATPCTWYTDADGDGYGDSTAPVRGPCDDRPPGVVDDARDCDDGSASAHPGGSEVCDGLDNDCNGAFDDVETTPVPLLAGLPMPTLLDASVSGDLADVDGDGVLDFLLCGDVALSDGPPVLVDGSWSTTHERWLAGGTCHDQEAADLDGDGDLDIATLLGDPPQFAWGANDGSGHFPTVATLADGLEAGATLSAGDFDGNGATDLASAPWVFWNEGGGVFTAVAGPCHPGGDRWSALPLLPDGRSALICEEGASAVATVTRTWTLIPVDSRCTFGLPSSGPTRVLDFDGDGLLDTVAAYHDVDLCRGDGRGLLAPAGRLWETSGDTWITGFADADADGWQDFVLNGQGTDDAWDIVVFQGDGTSFREVGHYPIPEDHHTGGGALWQDLDGDATADLVAWESDAWSYPADGAGGFVAPWFGEFLDGKGPTRSAVLDLDGDALPDLVACDETTVRVWRNRGDRTFEGPEVLANPYDRDDWIPWPVAVDLDADGRVEVLITTSHGGDLLLLEDTGGTLGLTAGLTLPFDLRETRMHAGDLDGDGDDELVVENAPLAGGLPEEDEGIRVGGLAMTGFPDVSRWFDLVDLVGPGTVLAIPDPADLDGDGRDDIALFDADGVSVWSWAGTGTGLVERGRSEVAWMAGATDLTSHRASGVLDRDGDGDVDLLVALRGEAALLVLENDGAGAFTLGERIEGADDLSGNPGSEIGDLDGNGFIEGWNVTVPDDEHAEVHLWREHPSRGLEPVTAGASPIAHTSEVTDLDQDGVLDWTGASERRVWVHWGTGEVAEIGGCGG